MKVVWASSYPPLRESAIPEIQDLNVLDEFRRRGVASRLLDHAEAEISKRSAFVGIGVGLTLAITQPRGCMSCAGMCPMLWV